MIKCLKRFSFIRTIIKETAGMRKKLRKLIVKIGIFQLIPQFYQVLIFFFFRLI